MSQLPKVNERRPRVVVFTQGPDATVIATEGKVSAPKILNVTL